jgi:hypothetical protein
VVSEDLRFQERTWRFQRLGWVAMGLLLLAALAGAFANGPISWATVHDPDNLVEITYERFQRHTAPGILTVQVAPQVTSGRAVSLHINEVLLNAIKLEKIVPEPTQATATERGIDYTIAVAGPGQRTQVRLFFTWQQTGIVRGEIGLVGRAPARFSQFVYP